MLRESVSGTTRVAGVPVRVKETETRRGEERRKVMKMSGCFCLLNLKATMEVNGR
jgi:hypothetical protein